MSGPTAASAVTVRRARTLAQAYRRFGEVDAGTSPLYEHMAIAVSESDEALRAIEAAPAGKRSTSAVRQLSISTSIASASPTATDNRWATRGRRSSCRARSSETGPSRRGRRSATAAPLATARSAWPCRPIGAARRGDRALLVRRPLAGVGGDS
jgi:hypothetical protein